jgi:hypothetical protein
MTFDANTSRLLIERCIKNDIRFVHARFGDYMFHRPDCLVNKDGVVWTPELAEQLQTAFLKLLADPGLILGDPSTYRVPEPVEPVWTEMKEQAIRIRGYLPTLVDFEFVRCVEPGSELLYRTVRDFEGDKLLVGNRFLRNAADMLNARFKEVHPTDAHNAVFDSQEMKCDLLLVAAGPAGKLIQAGTLDSGSQLDIGSSLDALFMPRSSKTRSLDTEYETEQATARFREAGLPC